MVGFRGKTAEQGRAESDPDQDLDDDERHRAAQMEDALHRDGQHQYGRRLDDENRVGRHAIAA